MYKKYTREDIDAIYNNRWAPDEDKQEMLYTKLIQLSESYDYKERELARYVEDLLDTL